MTLPRFFVPGSISLDQSMTLPGDVSHHLVKVLRTQVGDQAILFNGEGGEYQCTIDLITKKSVTVTAHGFQPDDRGASLSVHLGLCVLKKDAMDRALSKAVELGVSSVTPLISEYCSVAKKVILNRHAHWQQVVVSACEQCGLNQLPKLHTAEQLDDWVNSQSNVEKIIALQGASPLDPAKNEVNEVSLLIGPEGGFSEAEMSQALECSFQAVTFGQRILRAETAPIVAISVLHRTWGDF